MTSAEQKAEEIVRQMHPLGRNGSQVIMTRDAALTLITQAITQAQNDKLEEAALVADSWSNKELRFFDGLMRAGKEVEADKRIAAGTVAKMIANDLRSLQSSSNVRSFKEPSNA